MLLWSFMSRHRDEDEWWHARPDLDRYSALRDEMGERVSYEPPRQRKDDHDVHPLIHYGMRVGIPSAMAALLVYWLVMKLDTKQDVALELARTHAAMTMQMADQATRTERLMERLVLITVANCMNTAKSSLERGDCARASR